jgi:hypothetical protein
MVRSLGTAMESEEVDHSFCVLEEGENLREMELAQ